MTIVPIGNAYLQVPESGSIEFTKELIEQMQGMVLHLVGRILEESLETELDRFLEREWYVRRRRSKRKETGVYCSKCKSHQRQNFRRNGRYSRQVAVQWGRVQVDVPQVKCQCGGNVRFTYQTIRPRQRMWDDLGLEIQVAYGQGLSYRQIKVALDQRLQSSVGLRSLNRKVLSLGSQEGSFTFWKPGEAPPVVRVDGIWVTVMFATGASQTDRLGRKRPIKRAKKVPILAAQGVWPDTGRTQLIAWMRADGEDSASWQKFLEGLYEAGLTPENGLALLVSDGGIGFRAAYENMYWQVPLQRCVFHKLRNIARAIRPPAELDRQAAHQYGAEFLRSAARIWQAQDENEARQLYTAFCQTWQNEQPKAIRTLQRDFEDTLTFYSVQEKAANRKEIWPAHLLRTTSPLERMFREFRMRYRKAVLFHSALGLQAITAQIAQRFS
jgi:transposase-like protein